MKRKFLFSVAFAGVFFCGCSSDDIKSEDYYKNNPKEAKAKIKECYDKKAEFIKKNPNLKDDELEKAFKKSLGKKLTQECYNISKIAAGSFGVIILQSNWKDT